LHRHLDALGMSPMTRSKLGLNLAARRRVSTSRGNEPTRIATVADQLLQPHGFEGFRALAVLALLRHLAVAQGEHMELMLLEIDATGAPTTSKTDADHDAVTGVDELVRVSLKINVFKDLSKVLHTGLATSVRPRPLRIIRSVPPDGVRVGQLDQCVEIAAIDSVKAQT